MNDPVQDCAEAFLASDGKAAFAAALEAASEATSEHNRQYYLAVAERIDAIERAAGRY